MTIVNAYLYRLDENGNAYSNYLVVDKVEKNSVNAWAKKITNVWYKKYGKGFPYGYMVKTKDFAEVVETTDDNELSYTAVYFIGNFFKSVRIKFIKDLV